MTRGAGPRQPRRGELCVLWALVVWAILTSVPGAALAQQEQLLFQRQADYNAALRFYQAQTAAWSAQQTRWLAASDARIAAVNAGNQSRIEPLSQVAYSEAMELTRQGGLVEQADRALETARKSLQEALDLRQTALVALLEAASPALRQDLLGQIRGISEQLEELEPETAPGPALRYLPAVDVDPRDGRSEIQSKIALVERRIQDSRADVLRVNEELNRLTKQQNLRRMAGDARSNRDLFDNGPPGARAGRPADPTQGGVSATATAGPKTIEQRIEELTAYKALLESLQQQLRVRVASFQTRLGMVGGGLQ